MASPRSFPRALLGRFTIALVVSLALVVSGLVAVNVIIDNKISSIDRVQLDTATDTDPGDPANFLLIGSDTRQFIQTGEDAFKFGDPEVEGGQRSDTIMVIHVDPEQQKGFLVSFPRDLMVEIPGYSGPQKINAAFNEGPQKVIDTLKANFGVDIHHYLEIDFESFRGIVDAMGGVAVYLAAPGRDQKSQFEIPPYYGYRPFEPGCYVLDGSNALGYVRSRDYEEWNWEDMEWELTGQDAPDLHRIERQQTFMRRLAAEAVKKSINNPLKANDISDKAIAQLTADEGLGRSDINKLINAFRSVDVNDPNSIRMTTFPTTIGPTNTGLGSVLVPRQPEADEVLAGLRNLTSSTEEEEGPSPATIRVRVFNGSGVDGAAGQTSSSLQQQGFGTAGIGNNPAGNISTTQIRYRPGSEDKARVVQRFVGGVGQLVEDSGIVEADVVLVLGRDFGGVTPSPGAGTSTAGGTTPTTAPAAPSVSGDSNTEAPPPDPTQCS